MLSPSDVVDQVWHLHILHSADYRRFQREALGRPLDHTPSRGGDAERERHLAAYARTLELYRERFPGVAPIDVWPSIQADGVASHNYVRVDLNRHLLIRCPRWLRLIGARINRAVTARRTGIAIGALLAWGGCASDSESRFFRGPVFLLLFVGVWLLALVLAAAVRAVERRRFAGHGGALPEISSYEAAYLAGGETRAVEAALATLLAKGAVSFDADRARVTATHRPCSDVDGLELRVLESLDPSGPTGMSSLREKASELCEPIVTRLRSERLILSSKPSSLPIWIAAAPALMGAARIVTRLGSGRPLGGIIGLTMLCVIVALCVFDDGSNLTQRGKEALSALKAKYPEFPREASATTLAAQGVLPIAIALYGLSNWSSDSALAGFAGSHTKTGSSDGGCSAGCGGGGCSGGCGGGCGGCGGCGG
jgi:uncharacterized protein (TIGR04222 family)